MTSISVLRESVRDAAAVLLPVRCSGCGEADRSLCSACRRELTPRVSAATAGGVPLWSALEYSGVPRRVLLAFKESGRVDAAPALGRALRAAIVEAQRASAVPAGRRADALLPVLIPSTAAARRKRGFHPSGMMLDRACILVPPLWRALRLTRQTDDQAGLSSAGRAANRDGSLAASRRLRGRRCLIIDDIVTSGATVAEAARAIEAVGGVVVGAAAVARTPRRAPEELSARLRRAPSE
ncbi:ComF family protein [Leifsonia naganoensis]|uniref:Putative amidophosphoribosyltransferase n=1 Tax=Leifsonia naganoensis TaxID=150025 RepID=A0A853DSR8_9MICO|nr:phosphoribosyltransferase family protein [Leifsonia naganoensis]NYK08685.1 putative amidophosphoribosyltransferase [Leifsonia naganoensis]